MNKQVILAVVLFYLVSNPATYKLVESFLGRFFRTARNGSPTAAGLLVHAVVFGVLLMFLLPKISGLKHTHEHEHGPPKIGPNGARNIPVNRRYNRRATMSNRNIPENRKKMQIEKIDNMLGQIMSNKNIPADRKKKLIEKLNNRRKEIMSK